MADTITASVRLRELYTAELRGALQEELGLLRVVLTEVRGDDALTTGALA